jgi:regulator of replication initiation timing
MSQIDSELNARSLKEILSLTSTLRSGYEELVAENDKLRAALDWYLEWYTKEKAMSDELHLPPEIESLRQAYLSALRGWTGEIERLRTEAARLAAENEQLRTALREIDTACKNPGSWSEIVMERIIERVEEIARAALQDKSDESGEGKAAIEGEKE